MITFRTISATEQDGITEPVTLAEVKEWANIDHTDDDALLTSMITGARQDIEGETNIKLVPHDVVVYGDTTKASMFPLPYGTPTDFVINEIDSDEVETALDEDYYRLTGNHLDLNYVGPYGITYVVGDPITVPQALKEAIKMLVVYRYNNRGDQEKQQGLPLDIQQKIKPFTQVWL